MNKPTVSKGTIGERFSEANNHLKAVLELIDSIGSEPFIPIIRQNAMAHLTDKVENVQSNIHTLRMQLAHLDHCGVGHRCKEWCDGCGCKHEPLASGPGCYACMEIGAR